MTATSIPFRGGQVERPGTVAVPAAQIFSPATIAANLEVLRAELSACCEDLKSVVPVRGQSFVEDTAQLLFRTDSGATGTIDLSWSLGNGSQWYVTVDGTKASVRLGWDSAEINRGLGWERFGDGFNKREAYVRQLNDFADAVRYDKTPIISNLDAMASVAVIDAAYRSMQTGCWARVVDEQP